MKNVIMRRQLHVLATVAALTLGVADAGSAQAGPAARGRPTAEIFATDNTAIITDPADSRLNTRLTLFDQEVRKIIHAHGARSGSSTLLDGVFWSGDLRKATYERSACGLSSAAWFGAGFVMGWSAVEFAGDQE
ncbi:hypothetical protein [Streptomyces sp. RLB3-6]|uniref:hypothetical protein n=1 Tax=Streptomyces sp. RLB3-6 TaxID=2594457 RepID=UPI001966E00E|nr:hypothetical protein [Streptomyces sp. RLB3-6]